MLNQKTLYQNKYFDVIEVDGRIGVKAKEMSVAVIPYSVDEAGILEKIGLLYEYIAIRREQYIWTLITGTVEKTDDDLLATAIRELKEEGGIEVPETEIEKRCVYLGTIFDSKDSNRETPIFGINVTNLEIKKAEGDGSTQEEKSTFEMVPSNELTRTSESLPLSAFLRLFHHFYLKIV